MKHKIVYAVGGCVAAILAQTASPRASAAPGTSTHHPRLIAAGASNGPSVFTLRYVAFVAVPKTNDVASRYKGFPPVLAQNLNGNSRYAMTTTPEDFARVLQTDQPDHGFKVFLAGSTVLYDSDTTRTRITDGPNPSDPYALTLVDNISVSQNSDTTLDFVSQGTFSFRALRPLGDVGGKQGWDGENNEIKIGRTYLWGANRKNDGTCITWAFCILPGRLDQVASTWKRHDGARATVLASGKAAGRRVGQ